MSAMRSQWHRFCDELKSLGDLVEAEGEVGELDRAEGYRYLTRLLRLALEMNLEHGSTRHPSFYSLSHETAKIGADNPDNLYLNAHIDGRYAYEVTGNVGGTPYLSLGTKENRYAIDGRMISTGEVDLADLQVAPDGALRLLVSASPADGNWLPMSERSNMLIVRQTFNDRAREAPARLAIRRAGTGPGMRPAEPGASRRATAQYTGLRRRHREDLLGLGGALPARAPQRIQAGRSVLLPSRRGRPEHLLYLRLLGDGGGRGAAGAFFRAALRLLELSTHQPLDGVLDYRFHPVHLNHANAVLDADGKLTIHVSHESVAGLRNNLVTTGHNQGVMLMRWVGAEEHPVPELRRLKRSEVTA